MDEGTRKNLSPAATREERLAAKLRENLRRRKAQARQMGDSQRAEGTQPLPNPPRES